MVITERDRKMMRLIYDFRLTTREQIERVLSFKSNGQDKSGTTSKIPTRLRLFFQHGLVERIPIPVKSGAWAWRPVYRLSKKGAELVAAELGITVSKLVYWGKRDDQSQRLSHPSSLFVDHTLKINDVRIAVMLAAAKHGYEMTKWTDDTQLKSQEMKDYVMLTSEQGRSIRMAVIPDAYFVLNLGNRRAHFFLELDQATMGHKRWKTRVQAYLAYVRSGKYQERYQTHSLRILTVTTKPQRLDNLSRTTAKAGAKDIFWFTTLDEVLANNILTAPIWVLAGEKDQGVRQPLVS